jgi:alpha-amylase
MKQYVASIFLITFLLAVTAHTPQEWKTRTIYQILTDRFARTNGDATPCNDFSNYCGGTFQGIVNNLDYIKGMGFNAIWISPVIANNPGGYHGYWAQNLFEINPYFGTADQLKALVKACHDKDIWVMVDVVANHMGPKVGNDFSDKVPFNDASYYHTDIDCGDIDPNNQGQLETCWLAQLPDLNQDNDFVRSQLLKWITDLVNDYSLDGLRIDTVPYVTKAFWKDFTDASGVYTVGEVFNGYMPYDAGYEGPVDGILNYPFFYSLRSAFQQYSSMNAFQSYYSGASTIWPDQDILGNFVDNHDNARFLFNNGDHVAFKSALGFTIAAVGIPITYYGSEQAYGGGNDPKNREPLWTNMQKGSDIYNFLATMNNFRTQGQIWNYPQIQRYSDDHFYAFTRGKYFCAFTNTQQQQSRPISYHPYATGTTICNIFYASDCVTVQNGQFTVTLNSGEVKVYVPKSELHKFTKTSSKSSNDLFSRLSTKLEQEIEELQKEIKTLQQQNKATPTDPFTVVEDAIKKYVTELENDIKVAKASSPKTIKEDPFTIVEKEIEQYVLGLQKEIQQIKAIKA